MGGGAHLYLESGASERVMSELRSRKAVADSFNQGVREAISLVSKASPGDELIRIRLRSVRFYISESPYAGLELAGPYLLRYKKQINDLALGTEEGDAWFLQNDYASDLAASTDEERKKDTAELIPRLKEVAAKIPFDERGPIRTIVVKLLDDYVDYCRIQLAESRR